MEYLCLRICFMTRWHSKFGSNPVISNIYVLRNVVLPYCPLNKRRSHMWRGGFDVRISIIRTLYIRNVRFRSILKRFFTCILIKEKVVKIIRNSNWNCSFFLITRNNDVSLRRHFSTLNPLLCFWIALNFFLIFILIYRYRNDSNRPEYVFIVDAIL